MDTRNNVFLLSGGDVQEIFRVKSMFIGANVRDATNEGRADYVPVFLSETPLLFRRKHVELDVAMVQARREVSTRGGGRVFTRFLPVYYYRCSLQDRNSWVDLAEGGDGGERVW